MYLLKTIPQVEQREWIERLNTDPSHFVPLPQVPQQSFEHLVLVHQDAAIIFKVKAVVAGDGAPVLCGAAENQPVNGKVHVLVELGSMDSRESVLTGFQGIRYAEAESEFAVVDAPDTMYECDVWTPFRNSVTGRNEHRWAPKRVSEIPEVVPPRRVRCMHCHGRVRIHRQRVDHGPADHVEHLSRQDSEHCRGGSYFNGNHRMSGNPVT